MSVFFVFLIDFLILKTRKKTMEGQHAEWKNWYLQVILTDKVFQLTSLMLYCSFTEFIEDVHVSQMVHILWCYAMRGSVLDNEFTFILGMCECINIMCAKWLNVTSMSNLYDMFTWR